MSNVQQGMSNDQGGDKKCGVRHVAALRQAGRFEKQDLIQPPFTNLHPQGVRGIFQMAEIDEIVNLAAKLVA